VDSKSLSLAIIFDQRPDLLILDEPTNHLDLEMIEWLENSKKKILIYGDARPFLLERVCTKSRIRQWETIYQYKGNSAI
jgi:ATP-binding cassette subfamily F protein uup